MLRRFTLNPPLIFYTLFVCLLHTRNSKEHGLGHGRPGGIGEGLTLLEIYKGSCFQDVTHVSVVCLLNRDSLCSLLKIVVAACYDN